jgi:hypothetical protein
LEEFGFHFDMIHDEQLIEDIVVLVELNVLNVDHHLIEGNISPCPEPNFELNRSDQHFINSLVLLVKLSLFIVDPVQDELQVRNLRNVGVEV